MTLEELIKKREIIGQFRGIATVAEGMGLKHIPISYRKLEDLLECIGQLSEELYDTTQKLKALKSKNA